MRRPIAHACRPLLPLALAAVLLAGCGPLPQLPFVGADSPQATGPAEDDVPATVAPVPLADDARGLWYEQLAEGGQRAYEALLPALLARTEAFVIEDVASADVADAMAAVLGDHPELFWLRGGYTYVERAEDVEVRPKAEYDEERIDELQARIDDVAGELLAAIPADAGDYDRARICYEWIVDHTVYGRADDDQSITSVFCGGTSVCAGYTRAFQYLMHLQGIRCDYLSGGSHAWNLVWLDGIPTYVDVTWGDPIFAAEMGSQETDVLTHDYLCVTAEELYRNHDLQDPVADASLLPACDATDFDWYRRNGLYLQEFDPDEVQRLAAEAMGRGEDEVRIKLGSRDAYDATLAYISSYDVFYGYALADAGVTDIRFGGDESLYVVTLGW